MQDNSLLSLSIPVATQGIENREFRHLCPMIGRKEQ